MKKITFLGLLLLFCSMAVQAQTELSDVQNEQLKAANRNIQPVTVDINALLERINSTGNSLGFDDQSYTAAERLALRTYVSETGNFAEGCGITSDCNLTDSTPDPATSPFIWDRPIGAGPTISGLGPVSYDVFGPFSVDTAGPYTFDSVQTGWDGYLHLYEVCFNPLDQLTNLLAGDDDGPGGIGTSQILDFPLVTGTDYYLVTSGFAAADFGPFTNTITGPGAVTCPSGGGGTQSDVVYAYDGGFCSDDFGSFDQNGPYTLSVILTTANPTWFAGDFDGSGTLYVLDNATASLLTVDTGTGADTTIGPLTNLVGGHTVTGLAWNPNDSTMYALSTDGVDTTLYSCDLGTGTLTVIGNTGNTLGIWLAIDNAGNAFMADIGDDNLYSVDLGTGVGTIIGALGFNIGFAQDADFDPETGVLYAGLYIGGGVNEWATIDTATGAATSLGNVNANCAELSVVALEGAAAPPTNDTCANATTINCGQTLSGDTGNDTDTNGDGSPDEWFAVTSSVAGELITVSTCDQAAFDTILTVYDACGGTVVETNDDGPGCSGFTSELSFVADGSSTYYIAVDGFGGASGTFDLTVTCGPVNDDPCGAIAIECGVPLFGNTDTANDDTAAAPDCDTPTSAPGVWYVYEDTTGLVTDILVSTCSTNTDYDTKISVYTGDCTVLPLTCVAGNDDSPNCTNFQSEVEFQSDGNTTYYILVHGFGGATGNFELTMTCTPVPPPNDMIVNSIDVDEIGVPYTDPAVAMPAATVENGNPVGCDISGGKGVWYNFTPVGNGTATAEIVSPAGNSFVVFFTAPDENAIETDLEYFFQIGNQCAPGTVATINTAAGQPYYVYVVNDGGITDITIDGVRLGTNDNVIEGFSFYPNPTNGTLNLDSVEAIEDVAIYNLLGQQVLGQDVNATSTQLDTSSLATGAYLMKVTVNGQTGTYKVIKR